MAQMHMTGSRLEFVVVPIEGTVKRLKYRFDGKTKGGKGGKGLVRELVEEPAGYMVYFPRGHVLRIRDKKTLRHHGLDREPHLISLKGLNDPNSAIGKLLSAQNDDERRAALGSLTIATQRLATAKTGDQLLTLVEKEAA